MNITKYLPQHTSEVKYEVSQFPDSQQAITLGDSFLAGSDCVINTRLSSWKDLELLICTNQALKEAGVDNVHIKIAYLLGARSDRKFVNGSSNYIKTVLAPVINSQNFASVTVLDPHSDVVEACINKFKKVDNLSLVKYALEDLTGQFYNGLAFSHGNIVLVSPDAGALKKIYSIAEGIGYKKDIVIASKHRDLETGRITHTDVPDIKNHLNKDFFIIDDICDGGRTFIEIVKVIKGYYDFKGRIFLIVTHGIFSAGYSELAKYFNGIYCTNSYKDVADVENGEITRVKQLKVI
jgi:ribose-phosphate pyrophosphokinase